MLNNLEDILKLIVAYANVKGGKIRFYGISFKELENAIVQRIVNSPSYWFKHEGENYLINIEADNDDTFLKLENDYGYEFIRYAVKDGKVFKVTKEERELILKSQTEISVKCNSFISETEVIDSREIKGVPEEVKDELILFVKRNLLYSKENYWNISPERVENAINKALFEYDTELGFPIELSVFNSKKLMIKYFLGSRKDRRYTDDVIVSEEFLFGNRIRILTLFEDKKEHKSDLSENSKSFFTKNEKLKKMLEITLNPVTSKDIMSALNLKDRETFYNNYLKPAIKEGYVKYTIPEKPRSPKQRYVLTDKGKDFLKDL